MHWQRLRFYLCIDIIIDECCFKDIETTVNIEYTIKNINKKNLIKDVLIMESKVLLYNSNNVKVGETSAHMARDIVKRQRAEWIDNNHTAIRFYSGMEYMENIGDNKSNEFNEINHFDKFNDSNEFNGFDKTNETKTNEYELQIHHLCFARWADGKYYPAVVSDIFNSHAKVAYLDGDTGMVSIDHIIELYEGFETLIFQGNWKGWGYYDGVLSNTSPLVMEYNDGEVEQIHLKQLRGIKQ